MGEIAASFIQSILEGRQRDLPDSTVLHARSAHAEQAMVVGLYGELGSGKTAFMKEVARVLNVEEHVVSPTFVIERIYHIPERTKMGENKIFNHLIHIDAYRLEGERELIDLGWEDIRRDNRNLIFIEWADRVSKILPKDHIKIYFKHIDENTREVEITKT